MKHVLFFFNLTKSKALPMATILITFSFIDFLVAVAAILTFSWHIRMGMGHEHHLPSLITQFCTVILAPCEAHTCTAHLACTL